MNNPTEPMTAPCGCRYVTLHGVPEGHAPTDPGTWVEVGTRQWASLCSGCQAKLDGMVVVQPVRVAQRTIPRVYGGCDHGGPYKLLALMGDERSLFSAPYGAPAKQDSTALAWHMSRKEWVGLMEGYERQPARLMLITIERGSRRSPKEVVLKSGGRLSAALLEEHRGAIAEALGEPVASQLSTKHTVVEARASGAQNSLLSTTAPFRTRPWIHYKRHLARLGVYERDLARVLWPDETETAAKAKLRNLKTAASPSCATIVTLAEYLDGLDDYPAVTPESFYAPTEAQEPAV